jgi:hypothetical protein
VPNQPRTPLHSFRVSDEIWEAAKECARQRGETLADVLRRALEQYLAEDPPRQRSLNLDRSR